MEVESSRYDMASETVKLPQVHSIGRCWGFEGRTDYDERLSAGTHDLIYYFQLSSSFWGRPLPFSQLFPGKSKQHLHSATSRIVYRSCSGAVHVSDSGRTVYRP